MRRYYKFPRGYYKKNVVHKQLKAGDFIKLVLLAALFYAVVTTFFIGTYRSNGQTVVAVRAYLSRLDRGDAVLYSPEYYCRAPFWLAPLDILGRVATFQCFSASKALGFDTGYLEKRIAGVPGDTVKIEIDDDGTFALLRNAPEVVLGKGEYYLLDDDRSSLVDSRSSGPAERRRIYAKIVCRLKWPGR